LAGDPRDKPEGDEIGKQNFLWVVIQKKAAILADRHLAE